MIKIKKKLKKIKDNISDILLIAGTIIAVTTTFMLNKYIGLYLLALVLLYLSYIKR